MKQIIGEVAAELGIAGEVESVEIITNGMINQSYDVVMDDAGVSSRYVFQKVNVFVFKNPRRVMDNIEQVTQHVAKRLEAEGRSRDGVIHHVHGSDGKNYCMGHQGFWRVSDYIPDTVTINYSDDLRVLRSAGRAYGDFVTLLSDFDASNLYETLPNFHNTRSRFAVLMRHVNEDPCGRVEELGEDIERAMRLRPMAVRLNELLDSQELSLRVTHNDTKLNNVLFDKDSLEAKTVIDLDNVMPGLVAHDFGDAVRHAANTAVEDEPELSRVRLDIERFRAFAEGFIPEVKNSLTPMELKTLALGAFTMAAELGVRFLDDYITGDSYFTPSYRGHNLVRARCQLRLAEDMLEKLDEMNRIVAEISGSAV